jgi:hypothetical protein
MHEDRLAGLAVLQDLRALGREVLVTGDWLGEIPGRAPAQAPRAHEEDIDAAAADPTNASDEGGRRKERAQNRCDARGRGGRVVIS